MNLNQLGQSAAQFRQATEPMAQADARSLLAQAVPQALEQNDIGAAAGLSASVGEFGPLQSLIAARAKKMSEPTDKPLTAEEAALRAKIFQMPELASSLAGRTSEEADKIFALADKGRGAQFKREDLRLAKEAEDRRITTMNQGTITKVLDPVKKANEKYIEEVSGIRTFLKGFKEKATRGAMRTLAVQIARGSGEKGPLTELDLDPLLLKTIESEATRISNYLKGDEEAIFDPNDPQVKELERLAGIVQEAASDRLKLRSRSGLEMAILSNPYIFDTPEGVGAIKDTAKSLNLEVDIEEREGRKVAVFKEAKRQTPGLENSQEGPKTMDWTWIDSIGNQQLKKTLTDIKESGRVKTVEGLNKLRNKALMQDSK